MIISTIEDAISIINFTSYFCLPYYLSNKLKFHKILNIIIQTEKYTYIQFI